eukprot:7296136-Pyramimonas_sp.AAC.1
MDSTDARMCQSTFLEGALVMCGNSGRFALPHMLSSSVEFALLLQNLRFASTDIPVKCGRNVLRSVELVCLWRP